MGYFRTIAAAALALVCAAPAPAEDAAAAHWRALTLMDVEAAHRMLNEDHPGAAGEVRDAAFQRALASGFAKAKSRAAEVASYPGYLATLAAFSVSLGDKHIWSRPLYTAERLDWPGIIVARRGKGFVVAYDSDGAEGGQLSGATLLSCDGVAAERLADERLAEFKIVRGIDAQLVQRAAWLLLDDGNPFLERPRSCRFAQGGKISEVALDWRPIPRSQFGSALASMPTRGAAGFGVRKVGDGHWIAVQSFSDRAVPVIEEVRKQAEALRSAAYLVLDLRGNGGGNSRLGREIAEALLGPEAAGAAFSGQPGGGDCPKVWRVSDRNLKQLEHFRNQIAPKQGKAVVEAVAREYATVAAAKAAGRAFSGSVSCGSSSPAAAGAVPRTPRTPKFQVPVVLLTDNSCFSSCLVVVEEFRKLGALHVGEATDANTHYMEVREEKLPSGLSMFSTLQAVAPGRPRQMGPFLPQIPFEGSIADTAALESWVAGIAATRLRSNLSVEARR